MRIIHEPSRREAKLIKGPGDKVPVFKCWKHGGGNKVANAVKFSSIAQAAEFLRTNSGSGIRVAANGVATGHGPAIVHNNIVIEHDDGRLEKL